MSSVLSMKSFSAEVFGHERIPFLSVQHKAVIEPRACIKFSIKKRQFKEACAVKPGFKVGEELV